MDEANYKLNERDAIINDAKRVKRAIMDGDWPEVDKICSHNIIKSQKSFLFHVYIVQFLEYIHAHELQKAFTHLSKRIKPLEHMQTTPTQYADLCYLLTAKNIQDSPSFKNWEGIHQSR